MSAAAPHVPHAVGVSYEQRLRAAIMSAAPMLDSRIVPLAARSEALNHALAAGLPKRRDDLWRYADLRYLDSAPLGPVAATSPATDAPVLPPRLPGFTRLVLHNGRLVTSLSDPCPALSRDSTPLVPVRTRHERFGWLNDAFATDVARLVVDGQAMIEVVIASTAGAFAQAAHPRVEVSLRENAELVLVERHVGSLGDEGLVNLAVQLHGAPGSRCRHLRWQSLSEDAQLLDTMQVALDSDARYSLALLQLGSRSARSSLRVSLYGRAAQATICGVSVAGARRTLDTSLLIDHIGADTSSTQTLRALARERAQLAWRSRVEVAATARGTNCQQSLKGLLNNPGAEIDLRPQLEIHTDAVRASHGATTGALDQNMLFYLLSRGLDADTARGLLEWAFCEDAISLIDQPLLRRQAELALAERLGNSVAQEVVA
ncbi:MAG: SufD family Fe-S cluster assembly protein [Pseudomonadota bacterium]